MHRMRHLLLALPVLVIAALAAPAAQAEQNLYVSNSQDDSISAFDIGTGGALTPIGGPFTSNDDPRGVVLSNDGSRLYAVSQMDDVVNGYGVGAGGALSPLPGSPYTAGNGPQTLALSPDGAHLYTANGVGGNVTAFNVAANGSLTQVAGSPFATGASPEGIVVSPTGTHVYVASFGTDTVRTHAVTATGGLGFGVSTPAGDDTWNLRTTPDGTRLYASNLGDASLSGYAIAADGSLSPLPGSPYPAGGAPEGMVTTSDGSRLYVANVNTSNIFGYSIGANGALAALPASPYGATLLNPPALAITSDGDNIYAGNLGSDTVAGFDVAAGGELSAVVGSPFGGVEGPDNSSVAASPAQGPTAAFTAKTKKGGVVAFDGSGSSDTAGTVAGFAWDFGDGETLPSGGPRPSHEYRKSGQYTATLTATDDDGCSSTFVFNGQMAVCNGGPQAVATVQVTADTKVQGPKLKAKKNQKQKGGKVLIKAKASAKERVKLTAKGKIVAGDQTFKLKKVKKKAKAGKAKSLKLKLKKPRDQRRVIAKLSSTPRATISVKFKDDAGNLKTLSKKVKLG